MFFICWFDHRLNILYTAINLFKDNVLLPILFIVVNNIVPQRNAYLKVLFYYSVAEPGPATDLSVGDVNEDEISLSWKKPDYFTVTEYQMQYNDGGSEWKNVGQVCSIVNYV
jgi:hypothetical protein